MDDVARYLDLTRRVLPQRAREPATRWPVHEDQCFQRIVLDHVAGGTWYDHIARPAYKNLTDDQAARAVALCEDILEGRADLHALNQQSLRYRGKLDRQRRPNSSSACPSEPRQKTLDL